MFTTIKSLTTKSLFTCFLGIAALSGCSNNGAVEAKVKLYDRSSQALSIGTVQMLGGTYGEHCDGRESGSWNVGLPGFTGTVQNPLSVILDDDDCVLTLTSLAVDSTTYQAAPSIDLDTAYQTDASAFKDPSDTGHASEVKFYGNSKISSLAFAVDFTITMLYSDKPDSVSGMASSMFETKSATVSAENVAPPDYPEANIDTSSLGIQVNVNKVISSVAAMGKVSLSGANEMGDHYVVVNNLDLSGTPSYATVDAAFLARTQVAFSTQPVDVPVSAFSLIGEDLTNSVKRFIIVSHLQNGARSYQIISLTLSAP